MSEIPFVNQLGDAIETAVAVPRPARRMRRRRRVAVLALAVLLVGATGVTVARIFIGADQVASGAVACYEGPNLSGNVTVLGTITESPVAACAKVWSGGGAPPPLVACARGAAVVVFPGSGCRAAGLDPLPRGYAKAQGRVERLQTSIAAIEATADCIPPRELAKRAQALLERSGWAGWRTRVRAGDSGPCGRILHRGGSTELTLGGALLPDVRRLEVESGPPRSLDRQLFGSDSLGVRLMDASGERCFTVEGLEALARRELAVTGRTVGFKLGHLPAGTGLFRPRGQRYAQGCAVAVGAYPVFPEPGAVAVEVEIWRKGG